MSKRVLLLVGLVAVLVFAACGQAATPVTPGEAPEVAGVPEAPEAAEAPEAPATADEPVVLNAVLQINPEVELDNNPIIAEIEQRLNIRLNIEAPPVSGYGDRIRMMVAVGDMPHLLHYGADIFASQWAEEGLLLDVTDIRHSYANLMDNITEEQWGDTVFHGDRIHGVPRPNSGDRWGFLINTRWLDNLGLEAPRTVDEFIEVARAFTFDDPEGTGAITVGVGLHADAGSMNSGVWHLHNDFLTTAFGFSNWHAGMPDVDGASRLRPFMTYYAEYLQLLRDMFEEGILDREFITHTSSEHQEKFAMNRIGIIGASEMNYITSLIENFSLDMNDFKFMPPLTRGDREPMYAMPPSNWMAYYIDAHASPEAQDAALRLLDFANSEEGFILLHLGQAGVHFNSYDLEARTVDRTPAQLDARTRVTSNMLAMANSFRGRPPLQGGSTPEATAKWKEETAFSASETTRVYFAFSNMLDRIGSDFPDEVQTLNGLEVRFVTGEVSLQEVLDFVHGTYADLVADIAQEFAAHYAANPPRFVND
jgi:ABC-type glycerol-3-phosphate transport system substrate-binding protein